MAKLIINKQTSDRSGGTVAANAIIGFDTIFIWGTLKVHYNLKTYRSQEDYDLGMSKIFLTEIPKYGIIKTMTEQEYEELNSNTNALVRVAGWLKAALVATGNFTEDDLTLQP